MRLIHYWLLHRWTKICVIAYSILSMTSLLKSDLHWSNIVWCWEPERRQKRSYVLIWKPTWFQRPKQSAAKIIRRVPTECTYNMGNCSATPSPWLTKCVAIFHERINQLPDVEKTKLNFQLDEIRVCDGVRGKRCTTCKIEFGKR